MAHMLMTHVEAWLSKLGKEEDGQTLTEYALILALISIALIGALGLVTGALGNVFTTITNTLNGATG